MANNPPIPKEGARKKTKLPKKETVRSDADKLCTPIIKLMYPHCLLCPHETQVAHHHIKKSSSSRLRYEIDNLIPLCTSCHFKLHKNETYWSSKIVEIKGVEWFSNLDKIGRELVKTDVHFYIRNKSLLEEKLYQLENNL